MPTVMAMATRSHSTGRTGVPLSISAADVWYMPPRSFSPRRFAMPTVTIEYTTGAERLALGQAIASLTRRRQAAASAPDGTAPGACEAAARGGGRALLRDTLAAAVRGRVEAAEQNGGGAPCARGGDGPGASGGGARADA